MYVQYVCVCYCMYVRTYTHIKYRPDALNVGTIPLYVRMYIHEQHAHSSKAGPLTSPHNQCTHMYVAQDVEACGDTIHW